MASVGSLSSSTSSSIFNSANRITGLASGLDTDALVENMTLATRTKIAKQNQDKQLLQWKMDDYRSISSKLIAFQNNYLSYSSETNLRSPSFYDKTLISVLGDNSKYVSVSGTSSTVENVAISAVERLAKNNSYVSVGTVSDQKLSSNRVTGTEEFLSSELEGTGLSISYGNKTYTVSLSSGKTYNEPKDIVNELNEKLKTIDVGNDGTKLSEKIQFELDNKKRVTLKFTDKEVNVGNSLKIKGGSEKLMEALGFEEGDTAVKDVPITGRTELTSEVLESYQKKATFKDMVSGEGKTLSFTYNGTTKSIQLPGKDSDIFNADGSAKMDELAKYLEDEMDKAFGGGRIRVTYQKDGDAKGGELQCGELQFETVQVNPDKTTGSPVKDTTSVLTFNGGDANAIKALGLTAGDSNRVNLDASVAESGLKIKGDVDITKLGKDDYAIYIKNNTTGKTETINQTVDGKAFNANTSLADIIKAINNSDAKVEVSYSQTADKLTLVSTDPGASGDFSIVRNAKGESRDGDATSSYTLGEAIFGKDLDDKSAYTPTEGQDAVIYVDYDGEGEAKPMRITRPTNTFDIDGLSVTVNGTFGMKTDETGQLVIDNEAAVTFSAKVDTEKVTEAVKTMIEEFNAIIELTNTELSEKKNRDYAPLTDEQREEMSEDQIKAWEEKAKAGMLFNDSDLREFTSSIRFIFSGNAETIQTLSDMGITTSTTYSEHGKINFDEAKFKAALEANPETIADLFTRTEETTVDSEGNTVKTNAGIMNQIKTVFDKYAATTGSVKGIFVQMAGATESPLSMLDNYILDQMDDIDEEIERLQDKLETETERYYSQFASLETFISQMNSQSSWLSSQFA